MSQTHLSEESHLGVMVADAPAEAPTALGDSPIMFGLKRSTWIQIGVITALFAALFWPNLRRLWDKTNPFYGEANWGHAICIPFIGLYYLYVNREKLLGKTWSLPATRRQISTRVMALLTIALLLPLVLVREEAGRQLIPVAAVVAVLLGTAMALSSWRGAEPYIQQADHHSAGWFGGFVMVFGIAVFQYAIFPGQNDFLKDFGMVITLFGVVLALAGWSAMKIAWFPIAFLICGLPWPGLVYSKVAGPLQQLAANVAVYTLQITGVEASVGGTKISMIGGDGNWRTLNVAEACAGMRSLMTFISVAAAVAFLSSRPLWQKIIVVLFAIPIAIFCNVMRVSGQGLLDRYVSHSLSENFAHQFVGLIMLIPAFLLILLVGWVLDQIFVEQIDRRVVAMAPKVITRATAVSPAVLPPHAAPRSLAATRVESAPQKPAPAKPAASAPPPTAPAVRPVPPAAKPAAVPRRPLTGGGAKSFVPPPQTARPAPRPPAYPKRGSGNGDSNSPREPQ
ncbi:MAG TPA: exosortase/archaeosortase family protein [Tepidisphaeraceae bacterium]|jgi:exosortase|nr:exosortase/archaeosortase family protein [Tepidisphaeraceae bacterium]